LKPAEALETAWFYAAQPKGFAVFFRQKPKRSYRENCQEIPPSLLHCCNTPKMNRAFGCAGRLNFIFGKLKINLAENGPGM
jgi:hypothetical protein